MRSCWRWYWGRPATCGHRRSRLARPCWSASMRRRSGASLDPDPGWEMIRLSKPSADLVELPTRPLRRFTVAEYHRLIDAGVFRHDERFELLEGLIVVKMTRYPPHDGTISLVQEQLDLVLPRGWYCRIQSAVTTQDSEPEPDLAVVRGARRSYLARHPRAGDTA